MTLGEQIIWVEQSNRRLRKSLPDLVASGRVSQERASYLLAVAQATLETLTQLRGIATRGKPASAPP